MKTETSSGVSADSGLRTHCVAVTAYVHRQERFLLMKRAHPPLIWAPPGGRLLADEDPPIGVCREVKEETALEIEILGLVDYWFGEIPGRIRLLSLDFPVVPPSHEVILSEEHTDFVWASLSDLEKGNPPLGDDPCAFNLSDFKKAAWECQRYMHQLPRPRGGAKVCAERR